MRQRYQAGCLQRKKRANGPDTWVLRYREPNQDGTSCLRSVQVGTVEEYPTRAKAQKAAEAHRLSINATQAPRHIVTFGTLIDRYMLEALPERYSTQQSYKSYLTLHIKPKWGDAELLDVARNPFSVESWLKGMPKAPKTKAHIKALMYRLFEMAMKWQMMPIGRNPMELVEVKGVSKRMRKPRVLTVEQYQSLLTHLPEPYRTMVVIAQCLGLRISEILGLQWQDINFETSILRAERGVVQGRVDHVKTEYSQDDVPLDPAVAQVLKNWQGYCPATKEGWLFANSTTGKPYHASEIVKNYIKPAGEKVGIERVGWHTFRHTYRTLLDETGAPVGVQQKLMRHANVATTMNVYGTAMLESKRQANSKVVQMVLPAVAAQNSEGRQVVAL